jgi:glycosyltransferase involved in cell wall biosynthesis
MMKVLHIIENINSGGAAVATERIHEACLLNGVDSRLIYRFGRKTGDGISKWDMDEALLSRLGRRLNRERLIRWARARSSFTSPFTAAVAELPRADLDTLVGIGEQHDLVNLHLLGRTVLLEQFAAAVPKDFPLVVTLHDQETITGGCHYFGQCSQFKQSCSECPQVPSSLRTTVSKRLISKKRVFASRDANKTAFACISRWQQKQVLESGVGAHGRTTLIHHGIDEGIFNPDGKAGAKSSLGVDPGATIVLFGAAQNRDPRKRIQLIGDLVKSNRSSEIVWMSFGDRPLEGCSSENYVHLGNLETERMRAFAYKAADLFLTTSVEEAFGLTVLEALACGTPVVAFSVGGIPDMIEHGRNGYLVEGLDEEVYRQAVGTALENASMRESWIRTAGSWLREGFSINCLGRKYRELYESLF